MTKKQGHCYCPSLDYLLTGIWGNHETKLIILSRTSYFKDGKNYKKGQNFTSSSNAFLWYLVLKSTESIFSVSTFLWRGREFDNLSAVCTLAFVLVEHFLRVPEIWDGCIQKLISWYTDINNVLIVSLELHQYKAKPSKCDKKTLFWILQ